MPRRGIHGCSINIDIATIRTDRRGHLREALGCVSLFRDGTHSVWNEWLPENMSISGDLASQLPFWWLHGARSRAEKDGAMTTKLSATEASVLSEDEITDSTRNSDELLGDQLSNIAGGDFTFSRRMDASSGKLF